MTERPLRPGDGIVEISTGNFHFIISPRTRGPNGAGLPEDEVMGYVTEDLSLLYHGQYRRATFSEYAFNPHGLGKTPFIQTVLIHIFGGASILFAFTETPWALLGLMAPAGLWLGTWMNWRGRWV